MKEQDATPETGQPRTTAQEAEEAVYHAYEAARRLQTKHLADRVDFDVVLHGLHLARRFIFDSYSVRAAAPASPPEKEIHAAIQMPEVRGGDRRDVLASRPRLQEETEAMTLSPPRSSSVPTATTEDVSRRERDALTDRREV